MDQGNYSYRQYMYDVIYVVRTAVPVIFTYTSYFIMYMCK